MRQSETQPPFLDPDVHALWSEAIEEFQEKTGADEQNLLAEFSSIDAENWATIFETKFRKNDILTKVSHEVALRMKKIQGCVNVICSACDLTSSVFAAAAPASILVRGFAKAFCVFAEIQQRQDDIIAFFDSMDSIFADISTIATKLRHEGKNTILRRNVMAIFSCALKILGAAIASSKGRMRKAIKDLWQGGSELDGLMADMKKAKDNLDRGVNYATLKVVYDLQSKADRENRNDILDWLCNWDYEQRHMELMKDIEHGKTTGSWLLNSKPFQDWKNRQSSRLWYTGKPGAGKSVIASIIVEEMNRTLPKRTPGGPTLAFLHLTYRQNPKPTIDDLLGAVLRQLVTRISSRSIPNAVMKAFEEKAANGKHNGVYSPPAKETIITLIKQLVAGRPFYVIIDAMDECPFAVRKPLIDILCCACGDVRILVTARLLEYQDELAEGFTREILAVHKFLLIKLHMIALSELDTPENIVGTLQELPKDLEKTFSNTLERIKSKRENQRRQAISIIAWMSYAFRNFQVNEMCAALTFHTSLHFDENVLTSVCCGLVVVETDSIVRFVHYSAQDFFRENKDSLFQSATETESVHLKISHCCVQYLNHSAPLETQAVEPLNQPDDAVVLNSAYPDDSIQAYNSDYSADFDDSETFSGVNSSHPFAKYAAEFLHEHLNLVPPAANIESVISSLEDLLENTVKRKFYYALLQRVDCYPIKSRYLDRGSRRRSNRRSPITPLHLAVYTGCLQLIKRYIDGPDINQLDNYGQSPLIVALKRNRSDVVEILLSKGALVDLSTRSGHMVLLYVAQHDFKRATNIILNSMPAQKIKSSFADLVVILGLPLILLIALLKLTAQLWIPSSDPANTASEPSCPKVDQQNDVLDRYQRLLAFTYRNEGGDLEDFLKDDREMSDWKQERLGGNSDEFGDEDDDKDKAGPRDFLTTACFLAVELGYTHLLEAFLQSGIDPNLKNYEGQPLLHRAVFRDNLGAVKKLLEREADIDLEDDNRRTALTAHAQNRNFSVLKYLRHKGANVNHTGMDGVHELYRAAAFGNKDIMEFFLEAGVNPSVTNVYGWTPFHEASANGHIDCVKLLIAKKANHSPVSDTGLTPLDLVNSGQTHYDWPTLGKDSEHYLNGQRYRDKREGQAETDRREDIRGLIRDYGAMTSEQLYKLLSYFFLF
ncbi:ankyrin [Aspergillus uvarum CBS 121591]|uniref:Ankyrin n=1 Tax=Aspergillus uvarum CBS 121591 TaxID=1448315 RepID=A0A319BPT6_9EURO|nr:ankyrin [Aspergillus uvarum CBS 121591]PYH75446.1 ankyrin [Aspergillus uvarum CBS 121591]